MSKAGQKESLQTHPLLTTITIDDFDIKSINHTAVS